MKKVALASIGLLLLSVAGACGSDEPTADEKRVITSMTEALSSTADGLFDKKAASCVATAFVTDVGLAKLKSEKAVAADDTYNSNGAGATPAVSAAYTKAVLKCVKEDDALATIEKNVTEKYGEATQGVLAKKDVRCLVSTFVKDAGVKKLFSSQFVTDTGDFNEAGATYDKDTATDFAGALTGCVDYLALQAKDAADKDDKLNGAQFEKCLKEKIKLSEVTDSIVATLTQASDAQALMEGANKKVAACQKSAQKK